MDIHYVKKALKKWGDLDLERNIKITVTNLVTAFEVIRDTDYLAIVPQHSAVFLNDRLDKQHLEIKPLPFLKRSFTINMFYHKRLSNYKPLQWLIKIIKDITSAQQKNELI